MRELRCAMSKNPLVLLICSEPGMADRLLVEHADDGSGRCRVCSIGGQTGRFRWPCTIYDCASQATAELRNLAENFPHAVARE